jgi:TIGR03009 family protein
MLSFRPFLLLSFAAFCWGTHVSAQQVPFQPLPTGQPPQRILQPQVQHEQMQQPRIQQPQVQHQQVQQPRLGAQGGNSVYQQNPYPQAGQPPTAGQPQPPYNPNPHYNPTQGQYGAGQPPVRLALNEQILYDPPTSSGGDRTPLVISPAAGQPPVGILGGMPPVINPVRAEPAMRIVPYALNPTEQRELDEFLARWEKYSADIKRYNVKFYQHEYDPAINEAEPDKPIKIGYGYFMYIANPLRFVYHVEGEYRDGRLVKRDDKNPHIHAEKTIIDEKTIYKYDYNTKTMYKINVPPEMIGKGIADSPLPLIFGAKAADLKQRFSMRIVSPPGKPDDYVLCARPLMIEDQQEFKELEIMIDKKTLIAKAIRQWSINDKSHKVFELKETRINDRMDKILDDIRGFFTPTVERGWKVLETDYWIPQPPPTAAVPQPPLGNPYSPPPSNHYPRSEMPPYGR